MGHNMMHPMWNFPYGSCFADRDLPHHSLSCCITKCRAQTLSKYETCRFPGRVALKGFEPTRFSLKARRSLEEKAHCDGTPNGRHPIHCTTAVAADSGCFGGVHTWMLSYVRKTRSRTIGILRTVFARSILYYRTIGYWAANLFPHNSCIVRKVPHRVHDHANREQQFIDYCVLNYLFNK